MENVKVVKNEAISEDINKDINGDTEEKGSEVDNEEPSEEDGQEIKDAKALIKALNEKASRFNGKLEEYLKDVKKEIGYATQVLDENTAKFNNMMQEQLSKLAEENFSLRKLPEKVEGQLNKLVPSISSQIQKDLFKDCELAIVTYSKSTDLLNNKILSTIQRVEDMETVSSKKRQRSLWVAIIISVGVSSIFTYSMLQLFPTRVNIDTKGEITIDSSKVEIWNMGKSVPKSPKT